MSESNSKLVKDLRSYASAIYTTNQAVVAALLLNAANRIEQLEVLTTDPEVNKKVKSLENALKEIISLKDAQEIANKALKE